MATSAGHADPIFLPAVLEAYDAACGDARRWREVMDGLVSANSYFGCEVVLNYNHHEKAEQTLCDFGNAIERAASEAVDASQTDANGH